MSENFAHAIIKQVPDSFTQAITTATLGKPEVNKARVQHATYVEALKKTGVEIHSLPADERFPDSVFVEDVAIVRPEFAVLCSPGAESRRGEVQGIEPLINQLFTDVHRIQAPAFFDGGDCMLIHRHFYVGLSARTNQQGIAAFSAIVQAYGYTCTAVEFKDLLHLKTGMAYVGNRTIVAVKELAEHPLFDTYQKIQVAPDESYAANCIRINDFVLIPSGFPNVQAAIHQAGFTTVELPMSEFQKVDGGLSCLSLRW